MAIATAVPTELWFRIGDGMRFRDLLNLTLACKFFKNLASEAMRMRRERLMSEYHTFMGAYRRSNAYNAFQAVNPRTSKNFGQFIYHKLLLDILKGCVPASYVLNLEIDDESCIDFDVYSPKSYNDPALPLGDGYFTNEDHQLIRQAVETSPWILDSEAEDQLDHLLRGSEAAVLCILIPILSNLRFLGTPFDMPRLEQVIGRIASATSSDPQHGPLGRLSLINAPVSGNTEVCLSLASICPYAALPSVRRLLLYQTRSGRERFFCGWPQQLPLSKASEVWFWRSSVTSQDVQRFAAGFEGPCLMKQAWETSARAMPPNGENCEWDYYEIKGELDASGCIKPGTRTELIERRFETWPDMPNYMIGIVHND